MKKLLTMPLAFSLLVSGVALAAEHESADKAAKRCIDLVRLDAVRIIDNQTIRFEMHGGTDYLNNLPRTCPGLSKHKTIMYKTALHQLCDLDTVTVLDQVGSGFMRGATCGLGKFVPVAEDTPDPGEEE